MEEYQAVKAFISGWTEKAEALVTSGIIWNSVSQLQEQIRAHQVSLDWSCCKNVFSCILYFIFAQQEITHFNYLIDVESAHILRSN